MLLLNRIHVGPPALLWALASSLLLVRPDDDQADDEKDERGRATSIKRASMYIEQAKVLTNTLRQQFSSLVLDRHITSHPKWYRTVQNQNKDFTRRRRSHPSQCNTVCPVRVQNETFKKGWGSTFRNFKISNTKIKKDELFDFLFLISFHSFKIFKHEIYNNFPHCKFSEF